MNFESENLMNFTQELISPQADSKFVQVQNSDQPSSSKTFATRETFLTQYSTQRAKSSGLFSMRLQPVIVSSPSQQTRVLKRHMPTAQHAQSTVMRAFVHASYSAFNGINSSRFRNRNPKRHMRSKADCAKSCRRFAMFGIF